MAFGVRASYLLCGNARRIYLLLVLDQALLHRFATSSPVSRFGANSEIPAGGGGAWAGYRGGDAPRGLAFSRFSTSAESALSTDPRCARAAGERGLGEDCAKAARNSLSVRCSFAHDSGTSLSSTAKGFFKTSESSTR